MRIHFTQQLLFISKAHNGVFGALDGIRHAIWRVVPRGPGEGGEEGEAMRLRIAAKAEAVEQVYPLLLRLCCAPP